MSRLWLSVAAEERLLDEVAQRRRTLRIQQARVTPAMAQQAELFADAYPWMDPTATQSLLQAGVPADDPRVQEAAALAAQDIQPEPQDEMADAWYQKAFDVIGSPVKAVVRGALTTLAAPIEEVQAIISSFGEVVGSDPKDEGGWSLAEVIQDLGELPDDLARFWDNYTNKAAASGLRLAAGDLLAGRDVELGEGFLPGSFSDERMADPTFDGGIYGRRERDKHRLQLDGTFVTPGRLISRTVSEPGTSMYQFVSGGFDFGLNIVGDPAAWATAGLSKAAKANRAFQQVGLIGATRKTVSAERAVQHYLTSEVGQGLKRWIANTSDTRQIWEATGKADVRLAQTLARAQTETEVADILSNALGTVIREKPTAGFVSRQIGRVGGEYGRLFGGGAVVNKALNSRNVRIFRDMPGTKLDANDINRAADDLEKWMRNAKLGDDAISRHLDSLASVADGDANSLLAVARGVMRETESSLVSQWGVRKEQARKLTKMWEDMVEEHRAFNLDDLGREVDTLAPLRVNLDGKQLDASPTAAIVSDLIGTAIPLPDARDIRRMTPAIQQAARVYNSGLWKGSIDVLDSFMSMLWKPAQLFRGAYTVRVIGEEQVRIAGSGMDSLVSHPGRAIAFMVSVDPSSKLGRRFASAAKKLGVDPRGTQTITGDMFEEIAEHMAAMSRGSAGHRGLPGEILTGRWVKVRHGEDMFHRGWAARLGHIGADPVMRRLVGGLSEADLKTLGPDFVSSGNVFDDVAEWFWRGTGQKFRKQLATAHGEHGQQLLRSRAASDAYLRQNFQDQLQRMTGGNSDLMKLVATGELDKISIRGAGSESKLAKLLSDAYDDAAPRFVPMEDRIAMKSPGQRSLQRLDQFTERMFGTLMSKPTNWLSRSPAFRQFYYRRVSELVGFADEATQHAMIRAAREANIPKELFDEMVSKAARGGAGTKLTSLDDVDLLAKGFALDETKKLLYDLSKRSQMFDVFRLVFPFGEAWKEIITSWGRIMYQNPQIARRAHQTIHGGRGGDQDPTTGFFHQDPQTGEEVFTYPDFGLLSKIAGTGDTGRLSPVGRVAGLNVVSATVLPGFGPVIQIPVQSLVPNTPRFEAIHELVAPFGEIEGETPIGQFGQSLVPAWLQKVKTAVFDDPQKDRLFANTVMDVMRALHRSGEYTMDTQDDINRLYDDAVTKARLLYFIRGIAQSTVPTGPSFSWETADVDGNLVPVKILSDELRRMTDEEYGGDRNAAFLEWTRRFGVDNVLAIIPKSQEIVERPVTQTGDEWLRENPDLERDFQLTVGYFAPEPPVDQFDYDAYLRAFDTGARQPFKPDEMVALANDFLGRVEYEQAKRVAEMRPGPQTAMWLAQVREDIAQRRPGFDGWLADRVREQRPDVDQMVAEIRNAVLDPRIAQSDAGRGTIKYLSAIDVANRMVAGLGGTVRRYQTAKKALPIRMFLRNAAEEIIAEHPQFARVWTGVFERELADDTDLILGGGG